jgi:Glycine zipper
MTGSARRVVLIVLVGQQTGFDPANPQVGMAPPPPPQYYGQPQVAQGGLLRGAAGGAALGAVGGAIGGDAGKGVATGAGVGALFAGIRRVRYEEEQQQEMQQQMYTAQAKRHGAGPVELRACLRRVHVRARLHGPLMNP